MALLVSFSLDSVVFPDSVKELLPTGGKPEMLDSDVESFGDDSVSDLFVDDDAQSSGVDVEDCTGSAVVVFVWHTFVDGTIADDIDNIPNLVGSEVL